MAHLLIRAWDQEQPSWGEAAPSGRSYSGNIQTKPRPVRLMGTFVRHSVLKELLYKDFLGQGNPSAAGS